MSTKNPEVQSFFDPATFTLTYVVYDPATRDAVIIDSVLDFDPASGSITQSLVNQLTAWVDQHELKVRAILETHAHADHLSASQALQQRYGAPIAIGAGITKVQEVFRGVFDLDVPADGSQFDRLLHDLDRWELGSLTVEVIATPGHTPACVSYRIGDALFTGDALFMPDQGVGRCDFPAGSAEDLYASVHGRLYRLPPDTRVFVGHDYQPNGRPLACQTSIAASRESNIQLKESSPYADFVAARRARDATLGAPRLLLPSIQINMVAGRLPEARQNGVRYLSLPLKLS